MLLALLLGQGTAGPVTHDTSGALGGPGSAVAGAATRFRAHATSGALPGQTATVTGAADRQAGTVTHTTTGALTGQSSTLTGSAARTRLHATTGALTADGAIIVGSAARIGAPIIHDTSGVLTGPGAIIVGDANLIDPPRGGGGPGNAVNIQRRKPRGWANERAALEQSLREPDEQRQADLDRIAQTLNDSGQTQAQRIARKLTDYTGDLAQVESLQRELAKLEAAQRSRELWAERNQDVQAAAAELSEILRDDEDVAGALVALHEHETRLMLGALGIAIK